MIMFTAKAIVRELGFSLTKRDNEFRLAPLDGTPAQKEARAYYTDDLSDAVGTARQEAARAMRDAACEAHRAARQQERAATSATEQFIAYANTLPNMRGHDWFAFADVAMADVANPAD